MAIVVIVAIALLWPPVFALVVEPHVAPLLYDIAPMSALDLQQLLNARRYEMRIPEIHDRWLLQFESIVDGKSELSSGASVPGGCNVVLLLRQNEADDKIEYCWYTDGHLGRGMFEDPLSHASTSTVRREGKVEGGDWLMRGGRESLRLLPTSDPADFEVRVVLTPPPDEDE